MQPEGEDEITKENITKWDDISLILKALLNMSQDYDISDLWKAHNLSTLHGLSQSPIFASQIQMYSVSTTTLQG